MPRAQTIDEALTPCCGEEAPRQMEFPYYSLRDGFNSTVLLVSASPKSLDFVLAVRSRSGRTVLAPAMTIQPQEKLPVDLNQLLASQGADVTGDFAEGSVAVYFNGTIMPLAGQLTMTNPAKSLSLESEMVDNSPGLGLLPKFLNAVWWGLGGGRDARIMVTNTTDTAVTADTFLDVGGMRHPSSPLLFTPHETKVLSIVEMLGDLKISPAQAPEGGITIIPRGALGTLIAQGRITDPASGFSTSLNFPLPDQQLASALHASGVPIGTPSKDSPFVGTGNFIPHVIVRNLTGTAQTVTITIEYPAADGPQQAVLAPLPLGAYSTEDVSLDSAFGLLPLPLPFCSIRIQYSGAPRSVIGEVSSLESKGDLVIDSRVTNEADWLGMSGAHPWHLDDETESVLFLTNMGDQECPIGFQISAQGVHYYLTDLRLQPHETRAIDIRALRDEQEPDFQGSKMPPGAADGSVLWIRLRKVPVMGRLLVLQRHRGTASNYTCGMGCKCPADYAALAVSPTPYTMIPGETEQYTSRATFRDCNLVNYYETVTNYSTWSSSVPAVASVNYNNIKGLVKGWAGGTATITARYTDDTWHLWAGECNPVPRERPGSGTCNVVTVNIVGGNNFAFVGSDPTVKQYNLEQAQGTPSGGTYAWSKSNSRVSFDNASAALVTLTGNSASTGLLDTTLTVNYTYNQKPATPATRAITVRIFKFLQQSGSTQVIGVTGPPQWGYTAYAYYNLYTNPAGQLVAPGFSSMNSYESVTVTNKIPSTVEVNLVSGAGGTDGNSQIRDDLSLLSPDGPLPSNLDITVDQDFAVGGIFVRNNTIHYYVSGPAITNNGPFN